MESKLTVMQRMGMSAFMSRFLEQRDTEEVIMTINGIYGSIGNGQQEIVFGTFYHNDGPVIIFQNPTVKEEQESEMMMLAGNIGCIVPNNIPDDIRDVIARSIYYSATHTFSSSFMYIVSHIFSPEATERMSECELYEDKDNSGYVTFRANGESYVDSIDIIADGAILEARAHIVGDADPTTLLQQMMSEQVYEFVDKVTFIK